jgi:hypothetical protein
VIRPSEATIKKLFAVSGNRCAFPACSNTLVDASSGTVTGHVCHIKARRLDGPRYDASQSDVDRHAFDNLVLLCPIHHSIVDADVTAYTVERLRVMKADHENASVAKSEPSDAIVQQLLASIDTPVVVGGCIITTQNQMGGQVAHSITNIGKQGRVIDPAAGARLVADLQKESPEPYEIDFPMGDGEAAALAASLDDLLQRGGWEKRGLFPSIIDPPVYGTQISTATPKPSVQKLVNWLHGAGYQPRGLADGTSVVTQITVGHQT